MAIPVPAVAAPKERLIPPPEAVTFAPPPVKANKKPSVNPVAETLTIPVEVVAVLATIESRSPVVTKVAEEVNETKCPVVKTLAVSSTIVPVVAELATTVTTEAPVNTPEFVTEKALAEVEEEVISPKATTADPPIVVVDGRVTVAPLTTVTSSAVYNPSLYFTTGK